MLPLILKPDLEQQKLIEEELARARAEERKRILDVPSTSTGITSNGKNVMFRFNHLPDSDDDLSSPEVNGIGLNHNHTNGSAPLTTDDDEETNFQNSSMNDDYVCSSRSNSRLSSSYQDEVSSTENEEEEYQECNTISFNNITTNGHGSQMYMRQNHEEMTPMKNHTKFINSPTPDSGIATPGCSSSSSLQKSENKNGFAEMNGGTTSSGGGTYNNQSLRFMQKLSRVKKNHREFEESDSD